MNDDQPIAFLHRDHFQRPAGVIVAQVQHPHPRIMRLLDAHHHDRIGQHLPHSCPADLVPAS